MNEDSKSLPDTQGNEPQDTGKELKNTEFESTETFADDPEPPKEKTPEEEYAASFDAELAAVDPAPENDGKAEANTKRLLDTMTDDELKAVFDKARMVDELNERLTKTHKDAFGRIGSLEQTIRELKDTNKSKPQAVELNKEMFKHLGDYFGDDDDGLLDSLVKDLSTLQMGIPLTPNLDIEARFAEEQANIRELQQAHQQKLVEMQRDLEVKLLSWQHPDWQDFNTDPDKTQAFVDWQLTLGDEDRKKLAEASQNWDARTLGNALSKYKAYQSKKAEHERLKEERLAGNVPPTNGSGYNRPPPNLDHDYEAAFQKAFNSTKN